MPFGPGHRFLSDAPSIVQRVVERWQFGAIFNWTSGRPLTLTAPVSTVWQNTVGNPALPFNTPNIAGDFPKSTGQVTKLGNAVTYFPGLRQIADPSVAGVTPLNGLSGAFNNKAIADSQGNVLLVNPAPGQVGSMGLRWIEGPSYLGLDMNLIKRIRITETKDFELRIDTVNVLNHPNFGYSNDRLTQGNPTRIELNISSPNFGRITSASGSRRFTIGARLNF